MHKICCLAETWISHKPRNKESERQRLANNPISPMKFISRHLSLSCLLGNSLEDCLPAVDITYYFSILTLIQTSDSVAADLLFFFMIACWTVCAILLNPQEKWIWNSRPSFIHLQLIGIVWYLPTCDSSRSADVLVAGCVSPVGKTNQTYHSVVDGIKNRDVILLPSARSGNKATEMMNEIHAAVQVVDDWQKKKNQLLFIFSSSNTTNFNLTAPYNPSFHVEGKRHLQNVSVCDWLGQNNPPPKKPLTWTCARLDNEVKKIGNSVCLAVMMR